MRPPARLRILLAVGAALALGACVPEPTPGSNPCASSVTSPECSTQTPITPTNGRDTQLPLSPIAQQTEVWCWAATAEMVFRYYGLPNINGAGNFQCGIVAAYYQGACAYNCGLCVSPIGGMTELQKLLVNYGAVARAVGVNSPNLVSTLVFRALTVNEVVAELDASRPIVAGISAGSFPFPNFSQHVVVITGYDTRSTAPYLYVNDPFPYNLPQFSGRVNPYRAAGAIEVVPGRYRISYSAFVQQMAWGNSIYAIRRL